MTAPISAVTESSFLVTRGHINTRKVLHSHLTCAGLTQEEDKGDKPHKQYSSSCLLPACSPSREIWLQLRREQLGVSWKSRSTGECCQSSGVTGLMEEEKEEEKKLSRTAGKRRRFVSSRTVMGFIYSAIKNREERRRDGSERAEHTTTPGRDALVLSGVPPHLLPLFRFLPRLPLARTQETELPHCQHLTPDVFFCPRCLSQTKRKINNAFSPPFPLWCNFKKPMDSPPEAHRGKKPMVRNTLRMKVQGEKNFTLHSLKTLLTSEPQVAKPMRVKQGTWGWRNGIYFLLLRESMHMSTLNNTY